MIQVFEGDGIDHRSEHDRMQPLDEAMVEALTQARWAIKSHWPQSTKIGTIDEVLRGDRLPVVLKCIVQDMNVFAGATPNAAHCLIFRRAMDACCAYLKAKGRA